MPDLPKVTPELINQYQDEVVKSFSPATVKRKESALKRFFDWAHQEGHSDKNPFKEEARPKLRIQRFKIFTLANLFRGSIALALLILILLLTQKIKLPIDFRLAPAQETTLTQEQETVTTEEISQIQEFEEKDPLFSKIYQDGVLTLEGLAPALKALGSLLIESETITLSTPTASDGDITINPDGAGNLNLLFEGASGNFIDAENANLTSGSLYYGYIGNDSTTPYLLTLQSGSSPVTRFSVDTKGNTYVGEDLTVRDDFRFSGNLKLGDEIKLTSSGELSNIKGFHQTSGHFEVAQNAYDFAQITKTGSTSYKDLLTLTLDETGQTASNYDTLVLKRLNAGTTGYALYVDDGLSVFDSHILLNGRSELRFADADSSNYTSLRAPATISSNVTYTLPAADGSSSQVLSTNGSGTLSWINVSGGAGSLWTDGGTFLYPTSGEVLGDSTSGGANKIAGLYLADSSPLYFGSDNDINYSFSGTTLAVTTGNNDINFDSSTFFIDGSANRVGIGTNTPLARLHVTESTGSELRLDTVSGTNANSVLSFYENTVSRGSIYWDGTANDFVWTSSAGDISLTPANAVGIGILTPAAKLEVLSTSEQLRLSHTDDTHDARFTVDGSGNLSIDVTGTTITIADDLAITGGDITGANSAAIDLGEEVSGDVYVNTDLFVGGTSEDLANAGFVLGGDDLFVAGMAGIEGNIYTDGDFIAGATTTYSDGTITFSSTSPSIVMGDGGSLSFTDGSNTLFTLDDQGDYGFLQVIGKSDTGDPATCAEGDIYYNAFDNTIKICHESNTWEALDVAGAGYWTDGGDYLTPADSESIQLADDKWIGLGSAAGRIEFDNQATNEINFLTAYLGINNSAPTTQVHIGSNAETHSLAADDVLISSDLELDGVLYLDGKNIANTQGTSVIAFCSAGGADCSTTSEIENVLSSGSWLVENTANVGKAALMVNQTKGGELFTASASGTTKFTIQNDGDVITTGQVQIGSFAGAPTAVGSGALYYNSTDNQIYVYDSKAWISLDPTKADKNSLHSLYRALANTYKRSNLTNQYLEYEAIARGLFFDTFIDGTKTDFTSLSASVDMSKGRAGLIGGANYDNSTYADTEGNAYLGGDDANDVYYHDRSQTGTVDTQQDSSPETLVDLGIDPNWHQGVVLEASPSSTLISSPPVNLSTTYNGGLVQASGTYASGEEDGPIIITILSDNEATDSANPKVTFNWQTGYSSPAHSDSDITVSKGEDYTLETGTNDITITFTPALYHAGDKFKILSWWLEPATADDRGPKQDFPEHAYIVAGDSDVDILDADTNKLWMRFDQGTDYLIGVDTNNNPSSAHMLNGTLYVGANGSAGSGAYQIDFFADSAMKYNSTAGYLYLGNGLAQRNTDPGDAYHADYSNTVLAIADSVINDVHANTVPNYPSREITVSGWGYKQGLADTTMQEWFTLPYFPKNLISIEVNPAGSLGSEPAVLGDCGSADSYFKVEARGYSVGPIWVLALFTTTDEANFSTSNYYCYTWTATMTVGPQTTMVVAGDAGASIIHHPHNFYYTYDEHYRVNNITAHASYDYDKVFLAGDGTLYAIQQIDAGTAVLDVYYHANLGTGSGVAVSYTYRDAYYYGTGSTALDLPGMGASSFAYDVYATTGTSTSNYQQTSSNTIYYATSEGLYVIQEAQTNGNNNGDDQDGSAETLGSVKHYDNNYITEEMRGDIRGMWPFNGSGAIATSTDLSDASPHTSTITVPSGITSNLAYVSAIRGTGIDFDGTDDYLCSGTGGTCADDADLDFSSHVSMGAWVKFDTAGDINPIMSKGTTGDYEYVLYRHSDNTINCTFYQAGSSSAYITATTSRKITDTDWHHVSCSLISTFLRIYIDGEPEAWSDTVTGTRDTNSAAPLTIGSYFGSSPTQFMDGKIDEPFISATAISANDVKRMYEAGRRAYQSHGINDFKNNLDEDGTGAGGFDDVVAVGVQPNGQAWVALEDGDGDDDGWVNKIDLGSDTVTQYITAATDPGVVDTDVTSLAVSPSGLEIAGINGVGASSPGLTAAANDTSGSVISNTVALPENISTAYLWVNSYVDDSDGGSSLTVEASNDAGTTYDTCSSTNNDTNQDPTEKEYVCRFTASDNDLKVKFTFARTDTDPNNYITQYGVGWTAAGADIAENYLTDDPELGIGNLVRIKAEAKPNTLVAKTQKPYDEGLIGVVSARPGLILGPEDGSTPGYNSTASATNSGDLRTVPVALGGRVPILVSLENGEVRKGDYLTASNVPGVAMKATKAGKVVGQALEDWTDAQTASGSVVIPEEHQKGDLYRVLTFVDPGYFAGVLTAQGDIQDIESLAAEEEQINFLKKLLGIYDDYLENQEATDSGTIASLDEFMQGLTQNVNIDILEAVLVRTKAIEANIIKGSEVVTKDLVAKNKIVSPIVETETLSPIPEGNLVIDLQNSSQATGSASSESGFGKLIVKGQEGKEVASIDAQGNASFSGQINAEKVEAQEASFSGTLFADQIITNHPLAYSTNEPITREEIEEMLKDVEQDLALLEESRSWLTNTEDNPLPSTTNLYITETTVTKNLSVTNSIALGLDMIWSDNSLNTLSAPLQIQSLALAPIEIMAGKIRIDTDGNVVLSGNLLVAGEIESSGLTLHENEDEENESGFGKLIRLVDKDGNEVGSINASGSAEFSQLKTNKVVIASPEEIEPQNNLVGDEITTNATAGQSTIPANLSRITINNPQVTDTTLVYVTPTSSTLNQVLYVKSKQVGSFVVGFNQALNIPVDFNWWIIDLDKTEAMIKD